MRFKLLIASFALLMTQTVLADSRLNPSVCPAVDAFKNTGVSSAKRDDDGTWIAVKWKNRFETEQEWTFGVGNFTADFPSDALAKGNAAISGLVYQYGPLDMGSDQEPLWVCVYQDPNNAAVVGAAFTPTLTPEMNKLAKLLHRK